MTHKRAASPPPAESGMIAVRVTEGRIIVDAERAVAARRPGAAPG